MRHVVTETVGWVVGSGSLQNGKLATRHGKLAGREKLNEKEKAISGVHREV